MIFMPTDEHNLLQMAARASVGTTVLIEGCPVQFPFTPYPQQEDFMKCVIQALNLVGFRFPLNLIISACRIV